MTPDAACRGTCVATSLRPASARKRRPMNRTKPTAGTPLWYSRHRSAAGGSSPRLDGGPAGGRRALDLWLLVGIALAALGVIAVRLRRARTGAATGKPPPVPVHRDDSEEEGSIDVPSGAARWG